MLFVASWPLFGWLVLASVPTAIAIRKDVSGPPNFEDLLPSGARPGRSSSAEGRNGGRRPGRDNRPLSFPQRKSVVRNCRGHMFDIVGGAGAQHWLAREMATLKVEQLYAPDQPEANAARALLKIDVLSAGLYWAAYSNVSTSFSNASGLNNTVVKPRMEAIAKVVKEGNRFGIPLILSRRALFGREEGKGGGGKALLSGLVKIFGEESDAAGDDLRMGGSPGDAFVEKLYLKHGAQHLINDTEGIFKFGTLEFVVPRGCNKFFERAVCNALSWSDYLKFAARALQASSKEGVFHLVSTCSDMFPKQFVWDMIMGL